MNARVAAAAKRMLERTGHYARVLRERTFPGLAVLCYHGLYARPSADRPFASLHLPVDLFRAHCRIIRDSCHPMTLPSWLDAVEQGAPLPPRPVLVTFDDGYRSVFTLARPVLEEFGIPAVAFVCSDPVERRTLLWYDAIARERGEAEVERIKQASYADWRRIAAAAERRAAEDDDLAPMTAAELRELAAARDVEIGGHTAAHPVLAHASRDEQRAEILGNKQALESWTGRPIRAFAYPNGEPGRDFTDESVALVRECGFSAAFTTRSAFARSSDDRFQLPRFVMVDGISSGDFAHRFSYSLVRARS